ncbi:hypothetical protein SAMN05216308_10782 [Nitrosospira sp. Nsp13]|nr:hypothetical protein SAMN05216308_10782 [Nitrosospira sp. Nsp13]
MEEENKPENGLWPTTRATVRFLLWTIVFSLVGMAVISTTGFRLL